MPNCTSLQIRAIAAELPQIGLEDALAITLALLDREPESFSRNAARWASRFALEKKLNLPDTQLVLAALATLPGPHARAGAGADRALRALPPEARRDDLQPVARASRPEHVS
jgi:hypothetical protein